MNLPSPHICIILVFEPGSSHQKHASRRQQQHRAAKLKFQFRLRSRLCMEYSTMYMHSLWISSFNETYIQAIRSTEKRNLKTHVSQIWKNTNIYTVQIEYCQDEISISYYISSFKVFDLASSNISTYYRGKEIDTLKYQVSLPIYQSKQPSVYPSKLRKSRGGIQPENNNNKGEKYPSLW